MTTDQHRRPASRLRRSALLVEKASRLVQTVAVPSLVQLVMRVALAVPFWRSGILKWNGFLKLNDTAVTCSPTSSCCICPAAPIIIRRRR